MRVLLADDSPVIRLRVRQLLEEVAAVSEVMEAEDADSAIRAVMERQPAVLILDIFMPGGGMQVLKALAPHQPRPLVVVLTNYPTPEYRATFTAAGADHFLDKSLEFDRLIDILDRATKG